MARPPTGPRFSVLSDVVLASDTAIFQDPAHFAVGAVPADGVHVVWPMLLGQNRGRYFMLTGQILSASEAMELGVVGEVLPREKLLPRAWELAEQFAQRPVLTLRYTRAVFHHAVEAGNARHAGLRAGTGGAWPFWGHRTEIDSIRAR